MLLSGHGVIFHYASSHLALSAGLVSGVILLIVIKHLGWTWPYLCPSPKPLAQTLTH